MHTYTHIFKYIHTTYINLDSNSGGSCMHFTLCLCLWKRHESIFPRPSNGEPNFCFGIASTLGKEKLNSN